MRDAFVKTLLEIAKKDKNVILVTGDLGFGVLDPFIQQFPDQYINAGVSEQNMTSMATGLALEGKTVFTYSIGNFPTLRCLEQIRNDCAYHQANVKIVCVGGGFAYGALGMSHHATEDLSIMRALPNVYVFSPCDQFEAQWATKAVYSQPGTCYLRLGRGGRKEIHQEPLQIEIGKAIKIQEGSTIAIFSTGSILDEVMEANQVLKKQNINPAIFTFPTVKPIDQETIIKCATKYEFILTVEEHNILGGFGSAVAEVMAEINHKGSKLLRIGLNDQYSSIVGSQKYLHDVYGMSAQKIVETIQKIFHV